MSGVGGARAQQLSLIPPAEGSSRRQPAPPLDDATREIGRRGLALARAALGDRSSTTPARAA